MGLRPGHCYRSKKDRAYTRFAQTVPRRNYIGAVPGLKTRQFNMGNPNGKYTHILDLIIEDGVQVRDNAIESSRIAINRYLVNKLGKDAFFMRIRVYPYQILRENKQAQGAHADRIQKGMSNPFGKPIGRAVRTRKGQKLISVLVMEESIAMAKKALMRANSRMPAELTVRVGTDIEAIGTLPTKITDVVEEKPVEKEGEEARARDEKEAKEGKGGDAKEGEGKEGDKGMEDKGAEGKGDKGKGGDKGKEGKK
ncbi:MAG: 50S ribosomal protein L16 [Candidatus Diapherotrites archaeon]|nr:50S ribosomal protein L16 [Candidatus Micrarchaeota archaeon]MBU1939664.1 50S ribosomal protein L16 [Candidatus Micrarchaeota archaeon]